MTIKRQTGRRDISHFWGKMPCYKTINALKKKNACPQNLPVELCQSRSAFFAASFLPFLTFCFTSYPILFSSILFLFVCLLVFALFAVDRRP